MNARLWVGIATFLVGALLLAPSSRGPRSPHRTSLAIGLGALGLATLASTQPGVGWSISAISFSVISIVMLWRVLRGSLRR
jgi:hypothetical protein